MLKMRPIQSERDKTQIWEVVDGSSRIGNFLNGSEHTVWPSKPGPSVSRCRWGGRWDDRPKEYSRL